MQLGTKLYNARKKASLSQEEVAEKLGVSRQTISKWEQGESIPDVRCGKQLAILYNTTLDELLGYEEEERHLEKIILQTDSRLNDKVNWTKVWSKKYPVLTRYTEEVDTVYYASQLRVLLESLKTNYRYNELDAVLVLKDILAHEMKK